MSTDLRLRYASYFRLMEVLSREKRVRLWFGDRATARAEQLRMYRFLNAVKRNAYDYPAEAAQALDTHLKVRGGYLLVEQSAPQLDAALEDALARIERGEGPKTDAETLAEQEAILDQWIREQSREGKR